MKKVHNEVTKPGDNDDGDSQVPVYYNNLRGPLFLHGGHDSKFDTQPKENTIAKDN